VDKLTLKPDVLQAAKAGDVEARNALIVANLPNIRQAIPRIRNVPIECFLGVAIIAFMADLQTLDPASANPEWYIARGIRWAVLHQIRDETPGDARGKHREFSFAANDEGDWSQPLVRIITWIAPRKQEKPRELTDRLIELRLYVASLPSLQRQIILLRHYLDQGQSEAAANMNLSIAKAQECHVDAMNELRERFGVPHKPIPDRAPKPQKSCLACGNPIAIWNDSGYCSRTVECKTAWERSRHRPKEKTNGKNA
jgi:DNA-directed RNA polymerase specialized sigma subunit